ncbi:unnamed protein product [Brachionus calyciflorus]|uniref:Uncharacterized protein n=1 Tax=Brachionus calyciflorus TaxID=104777 RepID=A0A813M281_9BILA|nr:unnamed protein product [Brachionus calyciflorus]
MILKIVILINLILLTNGSLLNSLVGLRHVPRGKYLNVPLNDKSNRWIKIHYFCDGPFSSNTTTFLLESDFTSSHLELMDIQKELVKQNQRCCIWDKASIGYSDYLYSDMYNSDLYYSNFIKMLNESNMVLVGFGDSASLVLENAPKLSDFINKIILVDAYPTRLKWNADAYARNWTNSKLNNQVNRYLEKKLSFNKLINSIGIPYGLVSLFMKVKNFDFSKEKNLFLLNEKVWLSEKNYLEQLSYEFDDLFKLNYTDHQIFNSLSISHLMSSKSNEQIYKQLCAPRKYDANSKYCLYEKQMNRFIVSERKKMIKNGGKVYECDLVECNLEYFIYKNPEYTAKSLINLAK